MGAHRVLGQLFFTKDKHAVLIGSHLYLLRFPVSMSLEARKPFAKSVAKNFSVNTEAMKDGKEKVAVLERIIDWQNMGSSRPPLHCGGRLER
jgi:hypothetical protein